MADPLLATTVRLAHPGALIASALLIVVVAVRRRSPPLLSRRRGWVALGLRVTVVVMVVVALAGLELRRSPAGRTVLVLADRSASMRAGLDEEARAVTALSGRRRGGDRLGVVTFGQQAELETAPTPGSHFNGFGTRPNPNYTDIAAALRLGRSVLPADRRRQVVAVTDGRQNLGDALAEARLLRRQGVRLDVAPVTPTGGPEVRIDAVDAPSSAAGGARVHARVALESDTVTSGAVNADVDGAPVPPVRFDTPGGRTEVDIVLPPLAPGLHTVHAVVDAGADTFADNNVGAAVIDVRGTPRVMVVEGTQGAGANVAGALRAAAVEATVVDPAQVPRTATELAGYQAVVLVDVDAPALGPERMEAIRTAVRDVGVGLAAFGGPDTFGPGGMQGTPLEAALPVDMEISQRELKPPVAVVLVLESVESPEGDQVLRGAARSVVERLGARDFFGITDSNRGFVVPLQRLTDKTAVMDAVTRISDFGDPPAYDPFIAAAGDALDAHKDATRHIIVLGDGDASPVEPGVIADQARRGITVSAVGVDIEGSPQFMANMAGLAAAGKGRYYESSSFDRVPEILLDETTKKLKPWLIEQPFRPALASPSAALAGLDLGALPGLGGYVASTAKGTAEVVLRSPQHDPVLAQWQYGLGRSVAWTSDTQGRWSGELLGSPQGAKLLANIVGSTLPMATDPALSVQTSFTGDRAHLIVELGAPAGGGGVAPTDLGDNLGASASVVGPDRRVTEVALAATRPGRFEADVAADQVGSYLARVVMTSGGRAVHSATAGFVVPYSPEYRDLGADQPFLRALAKAGGGTVLADPRQAASLPLPPVHVPMPLRAWLLGAAALLWPLDVAVRRVMVRRQDAAEWRARLKPAVRHDPPPPEPTLEALGERLAARRRARRPSPP